MPLLLLSLLLLLLAACEGRYLPLRLFRTSGSAPLRLVHHRVLVELLAALPPRPNQVRVDKPQQPPPVVLSGIVQLIRGQAVGKRL